jgi:hypothetical protein
VQPGDPGAPPIQPIYIFLGYRRMQVDAAAAARTFAAASLLLQVT